MSKRNQALGTCDAQSMSQHQELYYLASFEGDYVKHEQADVAIIAVLNCAAWRDQDDRMLSERPGMPRAVPGRYIVYRTTDPDVFVERGLLEHRIKYQTSHEFEEYERGEVYTTVADEGDDGTQSVRLRWRATWNIDTHPTTTNQQGTP